MVTLNDLGYVNRGRSKHRPRNAPELYGGQYPFVQTADIKHAGLYLNEYGQTYSQKGLEQSRLWPAGTLCITIAANIADTAILGCDACFPDSVIGFIPDDKKCDVRYVKYLFDTQLQMALKQLSQGVAQDNLSKDKLLSIKFCVPDLPVQRRIADVLSAYDDLIENNRRRIAILEETARLLFQTDIVGGDWPCVPVSELIAINPKVAKPRNTIVRYVPMSALSTSGMTVDLHEIEMRSKATSVCFVNGDVLLARITPCLENGKTAYVNFLGDDEVACGSSEFIVMRGQKVSPYFTYCTARLEAFRSIAIKSMVGASGRQRVQESCFKDFSIQYPGSVALHRFDQTVKPMFQQIAFLSKQNAMLVAARDMLLPRLMKGQPCFSSL